MGEYLNDEGVCADCERDPCRCDRYAKETQHPRRWTDDSDTPFELPPPCAVGAHVPVIVSRCGGNKDLRLWNTCGKCGCKIQRQEDEPWVTEEQFDAWRALQTAKVMPEVCGPTFEERYGPWICMGCGKPHKAGQDCP